ncbi:MAG: cytidine deaminase [Paludibacteraceae bacterium]
MQYLRYETKITEYLPDEIPAEFLPLIEKAKRQTGNSYAVYSHFHVGAALLLENGEIVAGSNQENSAYPSGICAERTAIFYANSQYPDSAVRMIAIAAFTNEEFLAEPITPCGACRQVLLETENRYNKDIKVILYGTEKTYVLENVKQLLPLIFTRKSLRK